MHQPELGGIRGHKKCLLELLVIVNHLLYVIVRDGQIKEGGAQWKRPLKYTQLVR